MAAIILKDIRKSFGEVEVIKGVDIDIADGEFIVFVGPSGCGKSTLLRLIAGLEDISGGELWIGDRLVNDLEPKERAVAMVFQSYAIFPHMTVRENIAFGLTVRRENKTEIERKVKAAKAAIAFTAPPPPGAGSDARICSVCRAHLPPSAFSAKQLKAKAAKRKCKGCVGKPVPESS